MRFLVDMNLSPRWVDMLAVAGLEAAPWSMLGPHNASDVEIMVYARTQGPIWKAERCPLSILIARV